MPDRVTTNDTYKVGDGDVFLSLAIGEGQFGTSDVSIAGTQLLRSSGSIGGLRIGSGTNVKGKTLKVKSVVSDISTMTDKMSVTYQISGGQGRKSITAKGKVDKPGKSLIFETTFALS
jgi:hypothetical protein